MVEPVRFIANQDPGKMDDVLEVLGRALESKVEKLSQEIWEADLMNEMPQEKAENQIALNDLEYSCEAIEKLSPVRFYRGALQQLNGGADIEAILISRVIKG